MLLTDKEIRSLCLAVTPNGKPLLTPFSEPVSGNGIISYGLTSGGYDVRLCGRRILVFKNTRGEVVDPKRFNDPEYRHRMFDEITDVGQGEKVFIPPNGYILGQTLERVCIPRDLKARCVGKSTLARSGILINTTPMEPEWEGHLTLEIGNLTPCPAVVYVGEGIAQFEFEMLTGPCEQSYAAKRGKYQNQTDVTVARVK